MVYFDFSDESIHKMPREGGPSETLVAGSLRPNNQFDLTPDGKQLVVGLHVPTGQKLALVSIETGKTDKDLPLDAGANYLAMLPDGKSVSYVAVENGAQNIFVQPLNGSGPKQLSRFTQGTGPSKGIRSFARSPDGKQLAVVRVSRRSDVVLLKEPAN